MSHNKNLRSARKEENVVEISEPMKKYFDGLINNAVSELESMIKELKDQLAEKDAYIKSLEMRVDKLETNLEIECDNLQQFGRKSNIRIEGIEIIQNEDNGKLQQQVIESLNNLGAELKPGDIFRLHRSGKPHHSKDGREVAQTIIKFTNWSASQD